MPKATSADEAAETIIELELVRARVRADLSPFGTSWFPLAVFGVLTLASALVVVAAGVHALGWYWLVAAPLGLVLVWRHYSGLGRRLGVGGQGGAGIFAAGIATGVATYAAGALLGAVGAAYALSVGYVVMGRLARSRVMAVLGVALGVVTLALDLGGVDRLDIVLPAVLGAALLAAGVLSRP